ncbi:MAG: hypothetical protein ABR606_08155 [Vicinamibacterales bacterium]
MLSASPVRGSIGPPPLRQAGGIQCGNRILMGKMAVRYATLLQFGNSLGVPVGRIVPKRIGLIDPHTTST